MDEETAEFVIGGELHGEEGFSAELRRIVVDASGCLLTHLIAVPRHEGGAPRLVPLRLVDVEGAELRLRCTMAEFEELPSAQGMKFVKGPSRDGRELPADVVVGSRDRMRAEDGDFGRVKGVIAVPGDGGNEVTHVLVDELHLPRSKRHAVPTEAVNGADDGIEVALTKDQIRELPRDAGHRTGA
jgi:hypothetical protein